jgi:hypothetical protein
MGYKRLVRRDGLFISQTVVISCFFVVFAWLRGGMRRACFGISLGTCLCLCALPPCFCGKEAAEGGGGRRTLFFFGQACFEGVK